MRPSHAPLSLLLSALITLLAMSGSYAERSKWTYVNGEDFKGELVRVFGPTAYFKLSSKKMLALPVDSLIEEDRARVAAFADEASQAEAPDWETADSIMAKNLREHVFLPTAEGTEPFAFAGRPEPDFYVIYYSASWCGPCRQFTPIWVARYNNLKERGLNNFEVFFVSWDESSKDMLGYMREDKMPWPGVNLIYAKSNKYLRRAEGNGIPCLAILDRDGNILSHSYQNGEYIGPDAVVNHLMALLEWTNPDNYSIIEAQFMRIRRRALDSIGQQDHPPQAFHMKLDGLDWKECGLSEIPLTITVNSWGRVSEIDLPESIDEATRECIEKSVEAWLFLPKIENGRYVESKVRVPLKPDA